MEKAASSAASGAMPEAFADPQYHAAVVDLLGAIGYGQLSAFERLAEDATLAPSIADKVAIATLAGREVGNLIRLRERLAELGVDPDEAMAPFAAPLEAFHAHTKPRDWWEGLVKAFVGDALATDFYREIAAFLDVDTRELIIDTLRDTGHAEFVVDRVTTAIAADPRLGGRLALWGRRLMGEALTQAQRVAAERDPLVALLSGGVDRPGMDLAAVGRMFARLTERHAQRMADLGLDS